MSIERRSVNTARQILPYLFRAADVSGRDAPLVVFLHGAKDRGTDLGQLLAWGFPKIVAEADSLPYHFLALQIPAEATWPDWRDELFSLIDSVSAKHNVDSSRVVLSGFSLGSAGTWLLGSAHAERFAGLVIVSGRVPEGIDDARLDKLRHTPLWVFHGERDDKAPLIDAQHAVNALRAKGSSVLFTVVPEGDHFIAEAAYGDPALQRWLANIPAVRRPQAAAA
ncbi:PHB depolymerase family esterase [Uliginosibacterium sp. H3]|uniref:PHB depolymerase family esterase n=1 Tax=Uliginosibacterium silvisoli TaxID=3114758 RepID=A0ABU6K905_9RHOO|nr:PHB depolymerase family esterase [Uliginosibacterium sp. H3]